MNKKRIAFELNETLYKQIEVLAQIFHTNISTVTRQALQAYIDANKAKIEAVLPPKPKRDPRDDELLPNGMTRAEQIADYERKEREWLAKKAQQAAQIAERPRELSQTKSLQDIVADWPD